MTNQCVCGWGSAPDPAGKAYSGPPDFPAGLTGPILLLRVGRGKRSEWERREEEEGKVRENALPLQREAL